MLHDVAVVEGIPTVYFAPGNNKTFIKPTIDLLERLNK